MEQLSPPAAPAEFCAATPITINLKREKRTAIVRFPSDQEFMDRQRAFKTIVRRLGPDTSETKVEGLEAADLALYEKIRQEGSEDLDDAQASVVIQKLSRADAEEPTWEGENLVIPITVAGGIETTHSLKAPSEKAIRTYRRASFKFLDGRHGRQELKTNLAAIGDFYDQLLRLKTGYAADQETPITHKAAAVSELIATLDAMESEDDPANF